MKTLLHDYFRHVMSNVSLDDMGHQLSYRQYEEYVRNHPLFTNHLFRHYDIETSNTDLIDVDGWSSVNVNSDNIHSVLAPDTKMSEDVDKEFLPKNMNSPDKRSWLRYPMGVEYTFLMPKGVGDTEKQQKFYLDSFRQTLGLQDDDDHIAKVYVDSGDVIEVCSPVYRTWKHAKADYNVMAKQAKHLKLLSFSPNRGGGGGHINVTMPKKDDNIWSDFMMNLMTDLANRPYIGWIFNDPSDNHTANCLWESDNFVKLYERWQKGETILDRDLYYDLDNRGYSIRIKQPGHFEFRLFDMVRSEKDLRDHLQFVSAYMHYIEYITEQGLKITRTLAEKSKLHFDKEQKIVKPHLNSRGEYVYMNVDRIVDYYRVPMKVVINNFYNLLGRLNLKKSNYHRFVKRNYCKRVSFGDKYLL